MTVLELQKVLKEYGIEKDVSSLEKLYQYMDYILLKNADINLTAIKDKDEYINRMILDSILPLRLLDFNGKRVLDIGTGAGYPGTVIATLTNAEVDMLDSTNKKLMVISSYPHQDFHVIHARAEEYIASHREEYDVVIARAVSSLPILLELAIPYLKIGGYFIAMKGKEGEEELKASNNALKKLHANAEKVDTLSLASGETRINILIKKNEATNIKYPRQYNEIKRKPL